MKGVGANKTHFFTVLLALNCIVSCGPVQNNEFVQLNHKVARLYQEGKLAEALPVARQALDFAENNIGPEHPDTAACISNLGLLYQSMTDYAKAEPLCQRALKIRRKTLGLEHLDTADSLNNLAEIYRAVGKYAKAETLYQQALTIRETKLGPEHLTTAISLNNLAELYRVTGEYAKAEPLYQRALKIDEQALNPEPVSTAATLNNLAELYRVTGEYAKAEPLYQRALTLYETKLGPEHPYTATSLNNLGWLYHEMGDYAKAEPLYQQALKIRLAQLGPEHLDTAHSLNDLALLSLNMGDYAKAEPLYQRALKIFENVLGPEHPDTAIIVDNLAEFYQSVGDCTQALPLYQRALKIKEAKLNPEHPSIARSLNNLAELYRAMGDCTQAEPLYQRALQIHVKTFGLEHPDTASSLNNLAKIYDETGDYAKAEPLYQQALTIRETKLGLEHPNTADSLSNLAELYRMMGDYAKAEPLYQQALRIDENAFGVNHATASEIFRNLILLQFDLGRLHEASAFVAKYRASAERVREGILSFTSERQRMEYFKANPIYDVILVATLGNSRAIAESLLRNKGIVLDSLLEDQLTAEASKNPGIKETVDQLRMASRRLTQLQMIPQDLNPKALKRRQAGREALEQQVEDLQKTLARNAAAISQTRGAMHITVGEVQAVLPKNTVLMEFVRYGHFLGKNKQERRYGVVLIGSPQMAFKDAKPGEPVWVPLGPAETIERNLKEYGTMMRGARQGEVSLLHTLYAQLFEPIQKRLPKDITTLVISPDAESNFVSFATFVNDQDKFLAEQYVVQYVSSGRDLLLNRTSKKASRRFAAFANPAFGEKPRVAHSKHTVQLAMLSSDQRGYADVNLGPLPNTMQEAQFLRDKSSSWNMEGAVYADVEATEAEVKAVKSPYILHLATHGFFLSDVLPTNHPATRRFMLGNERVPTVLHNPMQRSGLAFAGAQLTLDAWKRGKAPDTENDGILMAQEVGTMDLKETWLVVLSACDTGIGEARAGEGVLGLRRGFIQAGTQNLLMTLWPVSDKYTVELMKAFYERAMKDSNAPQALAEVQRDVLVKIRKEKNAVIAARLAGPFVMTFQGRN